MTRKMRNDITRKLTMRAKMMLTVLMMILMTGHAAAQGVVVNGSVFGGGNEAEVQGDSKVNMETGTVSENVFGGGNLASVKGNVTVIMSGGTVTNDVYGGGALADTNTDNWNADDYVEVTVTVDVTPVAGLYEGSEHTLITNAAQKAESGKTYYRKGYWASGKTSASNTTNVYLLGGAVKGDVFGGGLGEKKHVNGKTADNPAYVDGDVKVYLNGFESGDADAAQFASILEQVAVNTYYHVKTGGCVVAGSIFGCNNLCGSPRGKVKVHVFKTVGDGQTHKKSEDKKGGSYELDEVYGGGNMAAYEPLAAESGNADTKASAYPEVIIDGCENTSISKVYGGGNAASTPATNVTVYGTYEIGELFGGGNGADKVTIDGDEKDNPGANVGFREYDAEWNKPYALASSSKQERIDNYGYGSGKAKLNIYGGLIHSVYGGSNTKGNVREVAVAMLDQQGSCSIDVDEAYGGGKSAPMDGEALLDMRCVPRVGKVFGGARHADVNNNVTLNITNGTFNKVFGGNNEGGRIFGSITVNVEEIASACYPIIIGELYAGGNVAGYSVYGNYEKDSSGEWQPTEPGANDSPQYDSPQLNLRSFTSIGNVYGGGYQAMVIGDPEININEIKGKYADTEHAAGTLDEVPYPKHEANTIGAIGNVYGGGFGADVKGSPKVNIGTVSKVAYVAGEDHAEKDIVGASITGSVYGGGYGGNTNVTGTATVNIGEKRDVKDGEGNVTSTTYHPHNTSIGGDIYGGSALGAVANTQVNLYAGSLTSNVFGGGMGQTGTDAKSATISTMATVSLFEATVTGNIYGGCNVNGTAAATTVNIKGGTVGTGTLTTTTNSETSEVSITDWNRTKASNVHGGGYGKDTYVTGSVLVNIGEENATSGPTIFGDVYGGGALGHVNGTKNTSTETGALPITSTTNATTTVNLYSGTIYGDAYGGGLGDATNAAYVGGTVAVNQNGVAYIIDYYPDDGSTSDDESTIVKSGRIFGCNNLNGYPLGNVNVTINKTAAGNVKRTAADSNNPSVPQTGTNVTPKYELAAVYGGGNLAPYNANNMKASVRINGCGITSIETVYGGGNAAAVPETDVLVDGCYEIGTVFGGGNGKDKYKIGDGAWTANPGANVGKTVAGESIGSGNAKTILQGGYIHEAYGGSNSKGTISGNITIKKQDGGECAVKVDHIYGAGKDADVEGDLVLDLGCSTTRTEEVYGCAKNANVKGNVDVIITSGEYGKVFGGNNESGAIFGRIKVHIEETGCTPIIIDELYGCGNDAAYSVYGYYQDGTIEGTDKPKYVARTSLTDGTAVTFGLPSATDDHTKPPYADPEVNIVSCTRIGKVFGGGLGSNATVYGNPKVNINQIPGKYALAQLGDADKLGSIGVDKDGETTDCGVFGGGNKARVEGNTTVNIGNLEYVEMVSYPKTDVRGYYTRSEGESSYTYTEVTGDAAVPATPNTSYYKKVLGANILSNVFGGGNKADVTGNTFINICAVLNPVLGTDSKPTGDYTYTSVDHSETTSFDVSIGESVYGGGSEADVKGNTRVTMTDGYVFDGVYGGGLQGSVGTFTRATLPSGHSAHTGCVNGKPDEWTTGTGKCTVVISGGQIGPVEVAMADGGMKNTGRYFKETGESGPVDVGFVFGAGRGAVENPYDDPDADFHTYVKETEVTISGTALIMASVYGGGENGRVRGNTKVKIEGGQIGCGVGQIENGKPKRYTDGQFIDPANPNTPVTETNALAGCATWDYGAGLPYDPLADKLYTDGTSVTDASTTGSDGHTYYGSVFGGGSGYYPYESTDGTKHDWLESAGLVEGDTEVEITGGHILTSVYGGNELTNVGGTCKVTMSGGTIGVPRTKTQIENNPSIGNLFGAGKGDKRVHFNTWTNVKETIVNVTGGIVYGSVFGGGEDGHVLEDATTLIEEDKTNNKTITIGSTGESGDDGNVFGGGRGSETALTAGVVGGNVGLTIKSGNVLGSVYGGGRLAAVGTNFVNPESTSYGVLQSPDADHGNITVNINGGTIGTNASTGISGNIYGGSKGTTADFRLGIVRSTTINMTGGTAYASVYGGGELAQVVGSHTTDDQALGTEINISGGTIGISGKGRDIWGNVYGGGKGNTTYKEAGLVKTNTRVTINPGSDGEPKIYHNIYGGGAYGSVGDITYSTAEAPATYVPDHASVVNMPTKWASNTGKAEVYVYGGTIGVDGKENGMVFASSRGDVAAPGADGVDPNDRLAWVHDTKLVIGDNDKAPIIKGSVYGSGENGHVFTDASVEIHNGEIGIHDGSAADATRGNVYGGGCGEDDYLDGTVKKFNPLAGIVLGQAKVTMDGGTVKHNVYGAGALGSVDNTVIEISGGTVGHDGNDNGNVYGAARGKVDATQTNIAQVRTTAVNIKPNSDASKTANIKGSVFGGGQAGIVQEDVIVNILGGQIGTTDTNGKVVGGDVYGGGALADTQTSSWDATNNTWATGKSSTTYKTYVNLLGGKILGAAYGGALGAAGNPAYVYGDTKVNLNGLEAASDIDATTLSSLTGEGKPLVANDAGYKMKAASTGAIVNRIFGANNVNGSPKGNVKVHVFGTQNKDKENIGTKNDKHGTYVIETDGDATTYDVIAVYGGGNEAAYVPVYNQTTGATDYKTQVIIEGCAETSIKTVYGGGNAASVPETNVLVKSAYEIEQVFGGGNGKDKKSDGSDNPGANIGIYNDGTTDITYGTGNANSTIQGGYVHELFGASNEKGTIKGKITLKTTQVGTDCTLKIDKIYNAGRNADVEGDIIAVLDCQPSEKVLEYYCGAENANVKGNVEVTITNGTFGKIFGGNNQSGAIFGHIKLNVEETGCQPIIIDELYGCGNDAAYSVFGYYHSKDEETGYKDADGFFYYDDKMTKPIYRPRTSATDHADAIVTFEGKPHTVPPYDDPVINITSATKIGQVFGGGYGANGDVYGNPTVNINMIPGKYADAMTTNTSNNPNKLGEIGTVYGGGNEADVIGVTTVNIGTVEKVKLHESVDDNGLYTMSADKDVKGAYITGNVYGGGKGKADTFTCEKAMVMGNEATKDATNVTIGNGVVEGSVYGGGEIGRVEWNTNVTIGLETGTSAPVIMGNVFGAGKGKNTHGYSALVRGNSTVTVQNKAKVGLSVYGGGEIASVGKYQLDANGFPYSLVSDQRGICKVTIKDDAEIGPNGMKMYHPEITDGTDKPDDAGHVFAGGKGILPYVDMDERGAGRIGPNGNWESYTTDEDGYFNFIKTLALTTQTEVSIEGNAFVKGSVYGGSENGLVQHDTKVYIKGGQIGAGDGVNRRYTADEWASESLAECASWKYEAPFAPYDPNANATGEVGKYPSGVSTEGGRRIASDGHTYYGNVFGGGSGSVPYLKDGISKYISSAGTVEGNTYVEISGGHILTSVYGGCEATNVKGTANVTMTGGTIGVPRTDAQILAHPVTCNLFGAGKGDQRIFFNKETNVNDAVVTVSGGRIYGSVFGGGEDGHILRNSTVNISGDDTKIGTRGTSYMDGNVFGGGRGFGGEALTAGNVGGAVEVNIESGSVLGSVYGGGRLASVGYGLYLVDEEVNGVKPYGTMRPDNEYDGSYTNPSTDAAATFFNKGRGYITININGGTIGNDVADAEYGGNVFGGSMGSIVKQDGSVNTQWDKFATAKKTTVKVTGGTIKRSIYGGGEMGTVTTDAIVTVSGGTIGTVGKGGAEFGNVYGGGKGYVDPAGTNYITAGIIKGNAEVAVSEADASKPTTIYHNIYGGGAYGSVGDFDYDTTTGMPTGRKANTTGGKATVNIIGGTIGTTGKENGMIFGSSRGDVGASGSIHDKLAWVYDTEVAIDGGQINGSVYGGGENGHVFHDAVVSIAGGTVGIADGEPITDNNGTPDDDSDDITYTGAAYPYRGNVYGGGCGTDKYYSNTTGVADPHDGNGDTYNPLAGIVYGNTSITMGGGTVVHNVYGAGAMGSVGKMEKNTTNAITFTGGGTTTIAISGGTVGVSGTVGDGNVFGAARGDETTAQTDVALVKTTGVTISGSNTNVWGNVYGGGETGDVGTYSTSADDTNTYSEGSGACVVAVTGGTVHHHVFGAGKGVANSFTCQKAMVKKTSVTISNGTVKGNVYGGGEVGRVEYDTEVKIGEGTGDGPFAPVIEGSVFGAGAGVETHGYSALVRNNSAVTVKGNAKVRKNVYGGGQIATVGRYWVTTQNPVEGQPEWPTGMPMGMPYANRSGGTCTVLVQGNATVGPETGTATETAGHVFGAGMGADPKDYTYADDDHKPKRMKNDSSWEYLADITAYHQFLETLALATEIHVTIGGTDNEDVKVKGSVYGGSENGFVQHHTAVSIQKGCEIGTTNSYGNIYGGGKGTMVFDASGRVSGHTLVTINDGIAHGSVYGGGEMGVVKEDVTVNINGGTIDKDVYGGGALANTNIGNWDATNNTWASGKTSASSTTHVNLTGGTISGDAYGGGLGRLGTDAVAAMVYGDVFVTLGTLATAENSAATATAFNISNYTGDYADVVKSGRVFGCNNLNGSPKGNVTVTVNKTVKGNVGRTPEYNNTGRPPMGDNADPNRSYEVAAVYGGGNLADYVAEGTGKKTHVIINTCDVSIEEVYGGGNAAEVPETNVFVNGAYEIEHVFGGGNGKDQFTLDGGTSWNTNPGADIVGNTNTLIRGGYVHEAYGASNEKGTITGSVTIDTGTGGDCQVQVDKLVAAGKNADVNGHLKVILGCKDATKIPIVYGGADNANVNGNVELTITSGHFGQVFGGNNLGGAIRGHIILNIEETSDCEPIRIDKLYLGGNQAAYSRFGYYVKTVETEAGTGKGASGETAVLTTDDNKRLIFVPRTSATDSHLPVDTYGKDDQDKWTWTTTAIDAFTPYDQPVLNLISCTEVGEVFGGGYGVGGDMYADPTVNINMIPGRHAEAELGDAHKLGVIGDVYGGGDAAAVVGDVTVNIGTAEKVTVKSMNLDETTNTYTAGEATVEGANITGNVFGGGKLADVGKYDVDNDRVDATGNTFVNIGAAQDATDATKYVAVAEGISKVIVAGNVFGGGKGSNATFKCEKAMVTGGTNINIGNGTVKGTVYGGGEVGRVENDTKVTIGLEEGTSTPVVEGYIFGAGKGDNTHGYSALVRGDTHVTIQGDAKVGLNVYGGGEIASVGRYKVADEAYHAAHPDVEVGMPYSTNQGGVCTVTVQGNAEIGPDGMTMVTDTGWPTGRGHVFGAGKGALPYENVGTDGPKRMIPDGSWESYVGKDTEYLKYIETLALTTMTDVTIAGKAFVKGSVYGGSENGHVQKDTHVTIDGDCQIGNGDGVNRRYTTDEWASETLAECAHWPYKPPYTPYDVYDLDANGKPKAASDGHTFYGNVFGGGSGIFPYAKDPNYSEARKALGYSDGLWLRSAGMVYGNTVVDIKGGHILTSVYGGNECTDVKGTTNVNMSGGTIGVPRTVDDIKAHPVTCYLFGAGKGDQRINFNTWTNVEKAIVNITGGRIFGSVFGGGEDGHVLGDVEMTISGENTLIGTTGTSYVDGNIFGGGRGFSGEAQTAGTVGGNIGMTISGGKILGSVYGGGRLASVGTEFTAAESPNYGNFKEDVDGKTYGHITIDINGGTIGNEVGNAESGNVFGASMGRLTLLNGDINPIWPKMAEVKNTTVTVSGGTIKRTVFGGGELGTVRDNATVNITGGTIGRDVYGAGYGSDDYTTKTLIMVKEPKEGVTNPSSASDYNDVSYVFTPMVFTGCVGQNTYVNVSGGYVKKSVYGGGEMASAGIIDCRVKKDNSATNPIYTDGTDKYVYISNHKHDNPDNDFVLSWPYHFENVPGYFGATHVNVTGGRIGLKGGETNPFEDLDNGDVVGGSKGIAGDFNDYVFCANVGSTDVTINYPNTADPSSYDSSGSDVECITGAVYGGAENGHVMGDTKVTLKKGLVGHSVYGGGSGKGKFSTKLLKIGAPANSTSESDYYTRDIYSITAGKVFGNTEVIMEDGYVVRNVYGGGNMGSVGKGNYAGGPDDYSTAGYGEKVSGGNNLWTNDNPYSQAFLSSGRSKVTILGGTVGYINPANPSESVYGGLPYGNVFGGCRGEAAPNISESPRYLYSPEFFVGYVNETDVTIGTVGQAGPKILGSVYGGGMDGHVRRDASVTINSGEIGSENGGLDNGNVYGAGSGIGKYEYDFNYDNDFDDIFEYNNGRATVATKEKDYSSSAGSVTRFTTVDIKGGTIHRNVYGGGSLSSVGAPKIGQDYDPYHPNDSKHSGEAGKLSLNKVSISGGQIGDDAGIAAGYGGEVNGGSRGESAFEESSLMSPSSFATSVWTDVTISGSADVKGNVFGGGEAGMVKHDTNVKMQGGTVGNDLYGGGDMADVGGSTTVSLTGGQITNAAYGGARGTADNAANVGGDVLVDLNNVAEGAKGCVVDKVFGANNVNGTPKGHVKVHVHATQNKNLKDVSTKSETKGVYDMTYVFGGGNASDYVPEDATQSTEVIIDGCGLTSIQEVYGGGYGAATPGTNVRINGTEIIDNVFGGGYGAGADNPGANVGYLTDKDHTPYGLYLDDDKTKIAIVNLMAGKVNAVYGGSNTKGDIRNGAATETVDLVAAEGACPKLEVGELYGGGKNAEMEGGAEIILRCMPDSWIGEVYAGAREAHVGNDVSLTITSGKFEHVYGGNKSSGEIDGYVEVNIEECPTCNTPLIIGELYGGGNEAAYNLDTEKYGKDYPSPRVNVRAFTSIGTIYGGGKGEGAKVTGNPTVSINVGMSDGGGYKYDGETKTIDGKDVELYPHTKGKIGVIGNVFGGGNAAEVEGNTNVLIGTESYVQINRIIGGETDLSNGEYYTRSGAGTENDPYVYTKATGIAKENTVYYTPVIGVDIKGNVYGGGNNAGVTGNKSLW